MIKHLDGRKIKITTKPGDIIKPAKIKTVTELGMPFHNSPYRYGNLYLEFDIIFPDKLNSEESKQITEVIF